MKKNWNINAVRLAMYTAEYNGYCTGATQNCEEVLASESGRALLPYL